ncbi:tripartite tricarboxylate transporter TctB family protein [uncultured Maritimibacter sp.]|uniref:tripartite tricarboxylate transporter TctB family protein n=1 Tax=uncultured Maritimibacter sp. TaxID=991866 RepID=UPI00260E39F0|nr:tripartite tricarboxylate transporter TctB family protein [uncultured Maritimibacter sp.]
MTDRTDREPPGMVERIVPGAALLVSGLVMLIICWTYPLGTLSQMGPGYVPMAIGVLICLFSLAVIVGDVMRTDLERTQRIHWRQLVFVSAAILAFGVLVDLVGLVPSMFVATFLSIFADDHARLPGALVFALLAAIGGWLLFIVALDLPISAFWR